MRKKWAAKNNHKMAIFGLTCAIFAKMAQVSLKKAIFSLFRRPKITGPVYRVGLFDDFSSKIIMIFDEEIIKKHHP